MPAALSAIALLAACNSGTANNSSAANVAAPANTAAAAPAPAAPASAPGAAPAASGVASPIFHTCHEIRTRRLTMLKLTKAAILLCAMTATSAYAAAPAVMSGAVASACCALGRAALPHRATARTTVLGA